MGKTKMRQPKFVRKDRRKRGNGSGKPLAEGLNTRGKLTSAEILKGLRAGTLTKAQLSREIDRAGLSAEEENVLRLSLGAGKEGEEKVGPVDLSNVGNKEKEIILALEENTFKHLKNK